MFKIKKIEIISVCPKVHLDVSQRFNNLNILRKLKEGSYRAVRLLANGILLFSSAF